MINYRSVKVTFLEDVLGSLSNNPKIMTDLPSKAPTPELAAEERKEILGDMTPEEMNDEKIEKQTTVFPRSPDGTIFCYDYQWRGFFKEALGVGCELSEEAVKGLSKWTIKKTVDSMLFVQERRIKFLSPEGKPFKEVTLLERPLRAQTMRGERICLARSEVIPAGSQLQFTLKWLQNSNAKSTQRVTEEAIIWALAYGELKGFGQWRGGGFGRFKAEMTECAAPKEKAWDPNAKR